MESNRGAGTTSVRHHRRPWFRGDYMYSLRKIVRLSSPCQMLESISSHVIEMHPRLVDPKSAAVHVTNRPTQTRPHRNSHCHAVLFQDRERRERRYQAETQVNVDSSYRPTRPSLTQYEGGQPCRGVCRSGVDELSNRKLDPQAEATWQTDQERQDLRHRRSAPHGETGH